MSSVVISGDTSGAITLSAPAVAGTNTITLPASTGTVALNGPAFYAYSAAGSQSVSNNTFTKVTLATTQFNLNNNYSTANSRFTPTIAGYYLFNAVLYCASSTNMSNARVAFYINGAQATTGLSNIVSSTDIIVSATAIYYMNGTTDYMELWGVIGGSASGPVFAANSTYSFFQGSLLRAA